MFKYACAHLKTLAFSSGFIGYFAYDTLSSMKEKFAKSALVFVALAVPLGFLAGTLVGLALKTANPSHIDITAKLAYLGPSLYAGYGTVAALSLLGVVASVLSFKQGRKSYAKTSLLTLLIIMLCVVGSVLAQKQTAHVEASYAKEQLQNLYKQLRLLSPGK